MLTVYEHDESNSELIQSAIEASQDPYSNQIWKIVDILAILKDGSRNWGLFAHL